MRHRPRSTEMDAIRDLEPETTIQRPNTVDLNEINANLSESQYRSAIRYQEDGEQGDGELFYDAAEPRTTEIFVNHANYTYCTDDQQQYYEAYQGSGADHGERIYRHTSGHEIRVFVTETEDDGTSPMDSSFWSSFMSRPSLTRYIYQGILDYCSEFSINA